MYILIKIFAVYAMGIIAYEHGFFSYLFIAIFVLLIFNSFVNKHYLYNIVLISFLILSFVNCKYNSQYILKQYTYLDVKFEAKIKTKNKINSDSSYEGYNAEITSINNKELKIKENTIVYFNKNADVKENSIISFRGSVADSSFSRNKMLFNYDNYLRSKKVGAVIFAEGTINTIKNDYSFLNKESITFKKYTENIFYSSLNKKNADIILSIILGDVDYLDESLYDNIKLMGLAHIFAVSGTHIVLLYGFLITALKYCFLSRRASWSIAWGLIWFYGFLIGFPMSVMRALVMFTLLFGSEVLYRKYNSLNSIGLAALVLTMYNPFWLFDAGFLLSFSAALSMIIFNKYIANHLLTQNGVLRNLYLNMFLQLFTVPVVSYYFNFIPVVGIVYNILLLPVFTVIIIYGFILLILNGGLSSIPFKLLNYILYSLRYIIDYSEKIFLNGITLASMSIGMVLFFYIMLLFMIYLYANKDKDLFLKKCGLSALISFCSLNFIFLPAVDNSLYFNVVDAGQGLFTLINYKNACFIFDCGSTSSKGFGEYTVVPYLTKHGNKKIDGIFISHWDYDHYSGLEDMIKSNIKVKKVFSSRNNDDIGKEIEILCRGNNFKIRNLKISILWPDKNYVEDSINNSSLVIALQYYDKTILLTGDIEGSVETTLLDDIVHCDVLVVPHHGSKTSSTEKFVQKVSPHIAVMSYGKNNYGIPSEEVIIRYKKESSLILSTFNDGEINFILKNNKIYYNTYTNEKSGNYYDLYLEGIINNSVNFYLLLYCIVKGGKRYELQDYN